LPFVIIIDSLYINISPILALFYTLLLIYVFGLLVVLLSFSISVLIIDAVVYCKHYRQYTFCSIQSKYWVASHLGDKNNDF